MTNNWTRSLLSYSLQIVIDIMIHEVLTRIWFILLLEMPQQQFLTTNNNYFWFEMIQILSVSDNQFQHQISHRNQFRWKQQQIRIKKYNEK